MFETIGPYQGKIADPFCTSAIKDQLLAIPTLLVSQSTTRLSHGADYVVKTSFIIDGKTQDVAIKVFKQQSWLKDWYDRKNKSKAERSFRAAIYLQQHNVGTPAPIAWLERWEGNRLLESYYVCLYEPAICFRDELSDIYYNQRDNAPLMDLLQVVASAIRAMHDAGFMHGDMGNQNILLPRNAAGEWLQPQFIDLNRSKILSESICSKQRAYDLARIALPGAYLKIFKTIYNNHEDFPADWDKEEQKARKIFWGRRSTGKWRHPIRHWKSRYQNNPNNKPARPVYPPAQDIWLWDEKSAQPMIVLGRKEKHLYRNWTYMFSLLWHGLIGFPSIYFRYKKLLQQSYQQPIKMKNRIGIALHPHGEYIEAELKLLEELGNPPVLIRFCHHETEEDWQRSIALVKQLRKKNIQVMLAVLQDRCALLQPESWQAFLTLIVEELGNDVTHIEITHASNRLKWGVWSSHEYAQLMQPALELKKRYPQIKITGPACIDFEYLPVIAALKALPKNTRLDALSHLLYVDRRGAPENKQGRFSTLEKTALLKALAQYSPRTEDKVIISEVNWPLKHTGIWSPIGCPYETPRWRREQPGETEEDYANYMLRFLAITLCSGHADQVFWWRLSAHGYGLVDDRNNFMPRLAFKALEFFLQLIGNATFERKLNSNQDVYLLQFMRADQKIIMAWSVTAITGLPSEFNVSQAWDSYGDSYSGREINESPSYYLLYD
jgi:tRNA A-37 threonylcarbamoyl transferase component Bud32